MSARDPIRDTVLRLRPNAIGEVSRTGLGDPDLIPLWFGETDLVTPAFIRDAAKKALDDGETFYTFSGGTPHLRAAIQTWTTRWYGVTPEIDRIWVPGAAMLCVVTALQCCVESGDEVIVIGPMWPNIGQACQAVGGQPVYVRLEDEGTRWRLDLAKLEAAIGPHTKAIFLGSPGNPTGWVISDAEIKEVLDLGRRRGVAIIADEVYSVMFYGGKRAPSFLDHITDEDNVFVVNSFSKAWAMTGWRIGWVITPKRLSYAMAQLSVSNNTGTTVFAQAGAVAALEHGDSFIGEMVQRCAAGRDIVRDFVATTNRVRWVEPDGAFYAYLHVDGLEDSLSFAKNLVKTARVGVAPGAAFSCGDGQDESYLRICFAQDPTRLKTALGRIADALR